MNVPLISIIIPVYNAETTIGRAINSILSQTSLDFELLLINDGSKDNSLQVMKKYKVRDSRIQIFNIANSGVSFARNYGIKHAQGKYITFLDADDYYVEKALEKILSELEEETQLVVFGYNVEYDNKVSSNRLPYDESRQLTNKKKFRECAVSLIRNELINAPWNKIYLTSYLKVNQILFPTELNIGEDLKFNISVIRDIKYVKIVNTPLVNYTVKKGEGLVSRFRLDRFEIRSAMIEDLKELLSYWGILKENRAMIDRMLVRDIMAFFMDFYKTNCSLTYEEKLKKIDEIISRKEIKEILYSSKYYDLSTRAIDLILRTNNCRFILLSAKILNIKRALR